MARTWLIDSRGIARKVKHATHLSNCQINDWRSEAKRQCPNCNHQIDNSDVSIEWPGLPAGVKFDPTDIELLEHLAAKVGSEKIKPHIFIDEFIPTLDAKDGICFTHPENLPGIKKDGSCAHFFHRTANAYNVGHRKRRKIHVNGKDVRWHKTGKTKPVVENGVQKGCKKIMVLYTSSSKGSKPDKTNWVMHQYHLGTEEDERDGEFVVSKIFYQHDQKNLGKCSAHQLEDMNIKMHGAGPRTPNTNTPNPPWLQNHGLYEDGDEKEVKRLYPAQEHQLDEYIWIQEVGEASHHQNAAECDGVNWLAGESQAIDDPDYASLDKSLFCDELGLEQTLPLTESNRNNTDFENFIAGTSIAELDDINLGTPPDLADLQFGSQESILSWLDRL